MDRIRSLDEYQSLALRTAGDFGSWEARVMYGATALAEEAGEVLGKVRKMIYHGYKRDDAQLKEELGDAMWAMAYLSRQLGYFMSEVGTDNIKKLQKRYPGGFELGGGLRDEKNDEPEDDEDLDVDELSDEDDIDEDDEDAEDDDDEDPED
jgi:NTP pyrophosphatase (non-canonical NTP hydrolase)